MPEVLGQGMPGDVRDCAGQLNPGRPPADDHERQPGPPPSRLRLALGRLEGVQDAAADLQSVLDALQPRRERLPVVMPEVRVRGPGRHNQVIVGDLPVGQDDPPALHVDRRRLGQDYLGVPLAPQDAADR